MNLLYFTLKLIFNNFSNMQIKFNIYNILLFDISFDSSLISVDFSINDIVLEICLSNIS